MNLAADLLYQAQAAVTTPIPQQSGQGLWRCRNMLVVLLSVTMMQQLYAGGYGSEDSEAYIPLLKSALQGDVTSRSAEDAPSQKTREGQKVGGDASHLAEASSQPAQEGTPPSEAGPSGGSASMAHHSRGADSRADDALTDKEMEVGMDGKQQQPAGGSMQLLGSDVDDAGASAGHGAKKRKAKGKKSNSRASKRRAQHTGGAEPAAEQDQDLGCPEAMPGSRRKQSLSDLREAALMWAQKAKADSPEKGGEDGHWSGNLRD